MVDGSGDALYTDASEDQSTPCGALLTSDLISANLLELVLRRCSGVAKDWLLRSVSSLDSPLDPNIFGAAYAGHGGVSVVNRSSWMQMNRPL